MLPLYPSTVFNIWIHWAGCSYYGLYILLIVQYDEVSELFAALYYFSFKFISGS